MINPNFAPKPNIIGALVQKLVVNSYEFAPHKQCINEIEWS